MPLIGINIPAPKVKISKENLEIYADLYRGIRDRKDTVSWRTLIITIRKLLGQALPDYKKVDGRLRNKGIKLIKELVAKTYFEPLLPEIEYAVGVRGATGRGGEDLDLLLLSGRHYPEVLLWSLADYAKSQGKKVAVINPVGHYNDEQTRVIGPFKFFHKIKKVVILSSTQSKLGGNISVLSNVIKLLRNNDLSKKTGSVEIIIPMFGGSRGHRFGQSQEVGYEVMEAGFNAQMLSLITNDVLDRLSTEIDRVPKVRFSSVDIHNSERPGSTFEEFGFPFISINSSSVLAGGIINIIKTAKMKAPLRLVACDKGAVPRTQSLAKDLIIKGSGIFENLQIVYLEKKRLSAGIVTGAQITGIDEWKKSGSEIKIRKVKIPVKPIFKNTIIIYSDDMIDTGGTAEKDLNFISGIYPNSSLKIFAATHPVFSKGFGAIKRIGADAYVVGNTLSLEGLSEVKGVEVVDFAEVIFNYICL